MVHISLHACWDLNLDIASGGSHQSLGCWLLKADLVVGTVEQQGYFYRQLGVIDGFGWVPFT